MINKIKKYDLCIGCGLCEAVITIPPLHFNSLTVNDNTGVGLKLSYR